MDNTLLLCSIFAAQGGNNGFLGNTTLPWIPHFQCATSSISCQYWIKKTLDYLVDVIT